MQGIPSEGKPGDFIIDGAFRAAAGERLAERLAQDAPVPEPEPEPPGPLVNIHVRRARKGRITGWIVQCEDCGDVTPVMRSKGRQIDNARMHGTTRHGTRCRIQAPLR